MLIALIALSAAAQAPAKASIPLWYHGWWESSKRACEAEPSLHAVHIDAQGWHAGDSSGIVIRRLSKTRAGERYRVRYRGAGMNAQAILSLSWEKNGRLWFWQGSPGGYSSTRYSGNNLTMDQIAPDSGFGGEYQRCGPPAERKPPR